MPKIHIWCPRQSEGARSIRDALRSEGIAAFKSPASGRIRRFLRRLRSGDIWINWGEPPHRSHEWDSYDFWRYGVPAVYLNEQTRWFNKRDQLIHLAGQGIPVPEVFNSPGEGRIGRSYGHCGGNDLLADSGQDYWVQRLDLHHEIRVHVFRGLSIRVGVKVHREGFDDPSTWIRTWEGGWTLDYSKARNVRNSRRELAKEAVAALGLDFGAVDIGVLGDGRPVVLEVNTAPGVDGPQSVGAYVRHFAALAQAAGGR